MGNLLILIAYALLPAIGNLIGNLIAEMVRPPGWLIGTALHGSAGIAIALIAFDMLPQIRESVPMWGIIIAFLLGAALSVTMARAVLMWQRGPQAKRQQSAWMVYTAVGADLLSDGLMTGAGAAVDLRLGVLIALAQLVANVPGGFAAAANLRQHEVGRKRRMLTSLSMFGVVIASATIGYVALRGADPVVQNGVLAVVVGLLLLAPIEDMVPEGDAPRPKRWMSTAAFIAGFTGLAALSTALGV